MFRISGRHCRLIDLIIVGLSCIFQLICELTETERSVSSCLCRKFLSAFDNCTLLIDLCQREGELVLQTCLYCLAVNCLLSPDLCTARCLISVVQCIAAIRHRTRYAERTITIVIDLDTDGLRREVLCIALRYRRLIELIVVGLSCIFQLICDLIETERSVSSCLCRKLLPAFDSHTLLIDLCQREGKLVLQACLYCLAVDRLLTMN